jgi:protein TonB
MGTRTESAPATPDPRRITALAISFLTHAAAALVLAIPLAATLERAAPLAIEASVLEQPPPHVSMPPEPEPLPRVRTAIAPAPKPTSMRSPAPVQPAVAAAPVEAPPIAATDAIADATDVVHTGAGAGESRILAYDGALKLPYPRAAIRRHAQGTVLLHVLVGPDGVAQRIEVSRSSGHRDLDDAARDAVRRARFRPVLENGIAIPAWGLVPIEFSLARG